MNNEVLMRIVNGSANLQEELQTSAKSKLMFGAIFGNGLTFNQLHYQIGDSLVGGASVKKLGEVGVIEASENLPFVLEASENGRAVLAGTDELERNLFSKLIVGAEGAIHLSHAAFADLFDDFVGANPASNPGGFARWKATSGRGKVFFA